MGDFAVSGGLVHALAVIMHPQKAAYCAVLQPWRRKRQMGPLTSLVSQRCPVETVGKASDQSRHDRMQKLTCSRVIRGSRAPPR